MPVRGCAGADDPGERLVAAQGMGREVEQTDRLAAGGGCAGAQARGHFALHLGGWHRVLVDTDRGESVIQVRRAPSADPGRCQRGTAASRRALPPAVPADGLDPAAAPLLGAWDRLDVVKASPDGLEPSGTGVIVPGSGLRRNTASAVRLSLPGRR